MKSVVLMLLVSVQVCLSNQQNIFPEHKRRHCNAIQTADIMEYALPEIRRILQAEAEENRRFLQSEAEKNKRLLQTEAEKNRRLLQTEAENIKRLHGAILLSCQSGWVYFNNNCYLFSQTNKPWEGAVEECQNMDAYLADIHSYEENRFLKMELDSLHKENGNHYNYFIGGYVDKRTSNWTWERTGDQIRYTDWGPNEPNNQTGVENCMTMFGIHAFQWNDNACAITAFFICKRRVEHQVLP